MAKMGTDSHQLLQITQHDKFFSKLLSKESSRADPSFHIYYCSADLAVPFVWESRPGTPKKTDPTTTPLPPLPPPPSRHFNNPNETKKRPTKNFIQCTLSRLKRKPRTRAAPVSVWASPRTSTSSLGQRYSSPRSSFSSREDASESADGGTFAPATVRGCYPAATVKSVFLSIVSRGRGSHRDAAV